MPNEPAAKAPPLPLPAKPYTAVVVFHGMGQQRHYETMWRIIESIDALVFARAPREADETEKRLALKTRRDRVRNEAGPLKDDEGVVYVRAVHVAAPQSHEVRFFEGYWAPATVAGTSAASVLTWLLGQLVRPLKVLCAPWRAFGRLRRADLLNLVQRMRSTKAADDVSGAEALLGRYATFTRRRPPESGSFSSFIRYLEEKTADEDQRRKLIALARRWRQAHRWALLRSALLLVLLGLSMASTGVLVVLGCLDILKEVAAWPWLTRFEMKIEPTYGTALSLAVVVATVTGVAAFLRDAVGDVQQFVTYQETDELHARRKRVVEEGCKTLRHVLGDDRCNRVVVVAHSLGSAVALDAILALRAFNECAAPEESAKTHLNGPVPLYKIEHLVTCGSPVDKITFFFATLSSKVTGFERMFDELRGDIGDIPFSKPGRQPHMHWVNFWDQGDPISGPLETVMPEVVRKQRVDNVRIASLLWPDMGASHDAYFDNPAMVEHLYDVSFLGGSSFASPPKAVDSSGQPGLLPDLKWVGPGHGQRLQSLLMLLVPLFMVMLTWTAVGAIFQIPAPHLVHLGGLAGLLLAVALLQRLVKPNVLPRVSPAATSESLAPGAQP